MSEKKSSLQPVRKEWKAPTCKHFGTVEELTLKSAQKEPVDPRTGRPVMGVKMAVAS